MTFDTSKIRNICLLHEEGELHLTQSTGKVSWGGGGAEVTLQPDATGMCVHLSAPGLAVTRLILCWDAPYSMGVRILGDHWERGYGDLEWRGVDAERPLPWYLLINDNQLTHGIGVATGASAFAHWTAAPDVLTLSLDVRCGGQGVHLGERVLEVATIVTRDGKQDETPFVAAHAFCRQLCPAPRLPAGPIYGGNDWYYAYGNNSATQILADAARVASWAPATGTRPFMVIDDGWQLCRSTDGYLWYNGGPWHTANRFFPDMPELANRMRQEGVRPGIWMRPLLTVERLPQNWFFPDQRFGTELEHRMPILDPSIPEVLDHIATDIRRLRTWGFELIKHDWSTYDLLGRWGFEMGANVTASGWTFSDQTRTTAEITTALYRTIREAADDAIIIGCNTVGHLAAGLFEMQRTGDDTSGHEWERTRKMGINTLAFRMAQHGAFFAVDADCVGLTTKIPWALNRQWLDLLARSGTPLFVSADPAALGPEQDAALRDAFAHAAVAAPVGEPLDWFETLTPTHWRFSGDTHTYNWNESDAQCEATK